VDEILLNELVSVPEATENNTKPLEPKMVACHSGKTWELETTRHLPLPMRYRERAKNAMDGKNAKNTGNGQWKAWSQRVSLETR